MKQVFTELLTEVESSQMQGIIELPLPNYSSSEIIEVVTGLREPIKFPSSIGAAYHIYKRPGANMSEFVENANKVIAEADATKVMLTQEGNSWMIEYSKNADVSFVLVTANNRVFLATYIAKSSSK